MASKVFIVVPGFGQIVSAPTFMAITALQAHLAAKGIAAVITTFSFPDIAELRSIFLTIWYDTMVDCDYILFVDSDMSFPPDLVTDMLLFGEPLVGTLYRQRNPNVTWAGSGKGGPVTEQRGNFILVEGVGMGCAVIRRDVVARMLMQFPALADIRLSLHPAAQLLKNAGVNRLIRAFEKLDIPDRGIVSEDLSFCIRWNQCGGQVWANIGHFISHVGPFDYAGCYRDHVQQSEAGRIQQEQIASAALEKLLGGEEKPQLMIAAE